MGAPYLEGTASNMAGVGHDDAEKGEREDVDEFHCCSFRLVEMADALYRIEMSWICLPSFPRDESRHAKFPTTAVRTNFQSAVA